MSSPDHPPPPPSAAPYIIIDVETSGLDSKACDVLEFAAIFCDTSLTPLGHAHHFAVLERPSSADPVSLAVAGYIDHRGQWDDAIPQAELARLIHSYTDNRILVAHNVDFDRGFLAATMRRALLTPRWRARQVCTLKAMRDALKRGLVKGESASLQASCARFGIPFSREEGASHSALADVEATRQVAQALVRVGALRLL